jgi:hypothetical protein
MENGKLILDACCGSRMFWFDKKTLWLCLLTLGTKNTFFVMGGI